MLYDIAITFVGCLLTIAPLLLGYIVAEYFARRAKRQKEGRHDH